VDDVRRRVPATHEVLSDPRLRVASERLGADVVKQAVRAAQQRCRDGRLAASAVVAAALADLPATSSSLRPVLNATGVVVHTNLGRAPLSEAARSAVTAAAGATDVEIDLRTGRRGVRGRGAMDALRSAVPDAQDVHVVNNGAAALALVTAALAVGKEIIVARGELVEIGDGFRIPELLESLGARLREVGTTNRVRVDDYAEAIRDQTAYVLKIHPSNFVVTGFTASVDIAVLAGLPRPIVADIGSGLLRPHPRLSGEPDAAAALQAGAALVTASGDKLLGGPQCGLLMGQASIVKQLRRHPLARALRVDKLTLAALEATLRGPAPPVATALETSPAELVCRAQRIDEELTAVGIDARAVTSAAVVGGGGAPGVELPSAAVSLPVALAEPLRRGDPAVMGRVEQDRLLLDLIAIAVGDQATLVRAVVAAARS
jgi:L-seryl-tRNA(Ser) seleniumtransferase